MDEYNQETITQKKQPMNIHGIIFANLFLVRVPCAASVFERVLAWENRRISFTQKRNLSLSSRGTNHNVTAIYTKA